jgi:hypothetical protein
VRCVLLGFWTHLVSAVEPVSPHHARPWQSEASLLMLPLCYFAPMATTWGFPVLCLFSSSMEFLYFACFISGFIEGEDNCHGVEISSRDFVAFFRLISLAFARLTLLAFARSTSLAFARLASLAFALLNSLAFAQSTSLAFSRSTSLTFARLISLACARLISLACARLTSLASARSTSLAFVWSTSPANEEFFGCF